MSLFNNSVMMGSSAAEDYEIERSLRFDSTDDKYMKYNFSSEGNRTTWTISFWAKASNIGHAHTWFAVGTSTTRLKIYTGLTDEIGVYAENSGTQFLWLQTAGKLRDMSGWTHYVINYDSTQATEANRAKLFVNGVEPTLGQSVYPSQNTTSAWNDNINHYIGKNSYSNANYIEGYVSEVHHIDGQALNASSFGKSGKGGKWIPKEYKGTYGQNGFFLDFKDNSSTSALGEDKSGNSHDFTTYNFSLSTSDDHKDYDSVTDTPTNNFPIISFTNYDYGTLLSEGGLFVSTGTIQSYNHTWATMALPKSGKYYCEVRIGGGSLGASVSGSLGVKSGETTCGSAGNISPTGYWYKSGNDGSWDPGDLVGIAWDADNDTIKFYSENSEVSSQSVTNPNDYDWFFGSQGYSINPNSGNRRIDYWFNFGQKPFTYTPPTGYVALCEQNITTEPTIADGTQHFDVIAYTGDGGTDHDVTGLSFQPDMVWVKSRSQASTNHGIIDVVRHDGSGSHQMLYPNATTVETVGGSYFDVGGGSTPFLSNGFRVNNNTSGNDSGETYIAWCWKAGGSPSNNTDGSVTSSVSANPTAGFSIVGYEGTGADITVGHGLGVAPDLVLIKGRETTNDWTMINKHVDDGEQINLNLNAAASGDGDMWGSTFTRPTSTVFTVGNTGETGTDDKDYIAYCFASVEGYSKVGTYHGNGDSNGTTVHTGFRPAFILTKAVEHSDAWHMFDSTRDPDNLGHHRVQANLSDAESTSISSVTSNVDFLANGFKWRGSSNDTNGTNNKYIYLAFAESPFKYSNPV